MLLEKKLDSWVKFPQPKPQATLRLFCFPYAGAGASVFRQWPEALPSFIEVCSVELPGRESRIKEISFTQMTPLVEAIALGLLQYLDKPFAFFGHSMGALVAFQVARQLRKKYGLNPVYLFVSGRRAPQLPQGDRPIHALPEPEFMQELRRLGGTPESVLKSPELMEMLMPILRADFEVIETFIYSEEPPLNCPIAAFGGLEDTEASFTELEAWQEQTTASFSLQMLAGDHFFINSERALLVKNIYTKI